MTVIWTKHAKFSFNEELEFILKKWNNKEVKNFIKLIDDFIEKLKQYCYYWNNLQDPKKLKEKLLH